MNINKIKQGLRLTPGTKIKVDKAKMSTELWLSTGHVATRLGITPITLMNIINRHTELEADMKVQNGGYRINWTILGDTLKQLVLRECKAHNTGGASGEGFHSSAEDLLNGESAQDIITFGDVRTKKEHFAAKKAQLDYEKAAGKVVDAEAVARLWADISVSVQKAVLTVPDRVTPLLVGEVDQTIIHQRMTLELKYALKNLSFQIQNAVDITIAAPETVTDITTGLEKKKVGRPKRA